MAEASAPPQPIAGWHAGTRWRLAPSSPIRRSNGYAFAWTGMKFLTHDGGRHDGIGVEPTHRVERTLAGVRSGRDETLERAAQILRRR